MDQREAQRFWDAAARENALFFVDNNLDYRTPDVERFWAEGADAVDAILTSVGVALEPDDVVVEIGCGVGRLTRVLAGQAARVIAIDISHEMLTRARELNPHLDNVEWVHGDGRTLSAVPDGGATACLSHVVFQHIPSPDVTLGYVREMGRVLRPAGWSAFIVSTSPEVHQPPGGAHRMRLRARALFSRGPRGQDHPAWLGSSVPEDALRSAIAEGDMELEHLLGLGTQFTTVLARRRSAV